MKFLCVVCILAFNAGVFAEPAISREQSRKAEAERLEGQIAALMKSLKDLAKSSACRTAADCQETIIGRLNSCATEQVAINKANQSEINRIRTQMYELDSQFYLVKYERPYQITSCGIHNEKFAIGCLKEKASPTGHCRVGNDPEVHATGYEFLPVPVAQAPAGRPKRVFESVMKDEIAERETTK